MDWALSHGYDQLPLMQTRDNVLVWGAAIPLGLFVLALFLGLMRFNNRSDNRPVGSGWLAVPGRQARAGDGGGEE